MRGEQGVSLAKTLIRPKNPGPFDTVAATYDAQWTNAPAGRAQRDAVWRVVDPLFASGARILDIGCGTGEDAAHYAARGVRVHATDSSPAMIAVARARGGFAAEVRKAEDLGGVAGTFDGALSNFGALNCVADLAGVARALAGVVRPGGHAAICVIGRFCAWEVLYYGARLKFGKAFRRLRGYAEFQGIPVWYPTVREMEAAFAPDFELQRWTGIGMLVPPSFVKLPGWCVRRLAAIDRFGFLRAAADHRLLIFVRKPC